MDPIRSTGAGSAVPDEAEQADSSLGEAGEPSPTLGFLLRRMRRNEDFPAVSTHIAEIRRATTGGDRASVGEVTNVILRDYALSTKLLRLVNSSFYAQYGGKISTISRAVVILGFEQVRMAALGLLLFQHLDTAMHARAIKELASQAFLSGVIGRNLARETTVADAEEAFVCAMLRNLGCYLTAYYLPEEFGEILRAVSSRCVSEEAACTSVLGLRYEDIATAVAQEWQLPGTVIQSMRSLSPGPVRESQDDEERMQQLAAMSDDLCRILTGPDPMDCDRAIEEVHRRYEKAIAIETDAIERILHDALDDARTFARAIAADVGHTESLRRAEIHLSRFGSGEEGENPEPAGSPTAGGEVESGRDGAPANHAQSTLLLNGIQDVTNALLENCALNDVLTMIVETIYRGLEFNRVLLCIADHDRRRMIARFGLGRDVEEAIRRFRFELAVREDPIANAMRSQQDIVYPGPNLARSAVPMWLRKAVSVESFVMLPVAVSGVCIGAIYCDFTSPDQTITADHLHYLDTLRNQAALAIKQRSAPDA